MGDEFALISLVGTIIIAMATIAIVLSATAYMFSSIGLYAMAGNRGFAKKAFWAWVPYGRQYLMGRLARDAGRETGAVSCRFMHILLPAAGAVRDALILIFFNTNSLIFCLPGILLYTMLLLVCLYALLRGYAPESAWKRIAFSAIIPLYASILIFSLRNRRPPLVGKQDGARGNQ